MNILYNILSIVIINIINIIISRFSSKIIFLNRNIRIKSLTYITIVIITVVIIRNSIITGLLILGRVTQI